MVDSSPGWLVLLPDLTPDWKAFYRYWMKERSAAERRSRAEGVQAFNAQQEASMVLLEASWAAKREREAVRKAELRHERQVASLERRREYKAAWMRAHRAKRSEAVAGRQA